MWVPLPTFKEWQLNFIKPAQKTMRKEYVGIRR